jgi:hypothetical protein
MLTYGILKGDRAGCSKWVSILIMSILRTEHCLSIWKKAKTIFLPKPCLEQDKFKPENWRLITLA